MVQFTDSARATITTLVSQMENMALRIKEREGSSPLAPEFEFSLVENEPEPEDEVFDADGFKVLIDADSTEHLEERAVDFDGTGFSLTEPGEDGEEGPERPAPEPTGPLADRVKQVIDDKINPGVAMHGGKITLRDVQDTVVFIEMSGGCQGCGMASVTLKQGVDRMLKESVPEVTDIRDVTDHAAGENPYYQSSK